jgi:transposase
VLTMDGASYHKKDDTLEFLKKHNVPVLISSPYSFDSSACELWFAYFKSQDLNPENLPTGKR